MNFESAKYMRIPKQYGAGKKNDCPFCGKQATTKNSQKLPVCSAHKDSSLEDIKCVCGSYLDIREGKFGAFFLCDNCGPMNIAKGLEMRNLQKQNAKNISKKKDVKTLMKNLFTCDIAPPKPKRSNFKKASDEVFIRSDDPRFF
jgi:predicted RNA-binding Zn-ribbon protein involved in translation (DUF1610 family)